VAWLIIPLVVVVVLYLRGFRKSALGVLIAAVAAAIFVYQYGQRADRAAQSLIRLSDVVLENVAIRQTLGSSYDLSGTLTNKSEHRLDGIDFTLTMLDCRGSDEASCVTIGEASSYTALNIPAGETRNFTSSFYFGSTQVKPKGRLAWKHEITALTARRQ
jgi:hypothetical protein